MQELVRFDERNRFDGLPARRRATVGLYRVPAPPPPAADGARLPRPIVALACVALACALSVPIMLWRHAASSPGAPAPAASPAATLATGAAAPARNPPPVHAWDDRMLLRVGKFELEPFVTASERAERGYAAAQLQLGRALLTAADSDPTLLPEALYWLFRAHAQGARDATLMLGQVYASRCDEPRLADHLLCHLGE